MNYRLPCFLWCILACISLWSDEIEPIVEKDMQEERSVLPEETLKEKSFPALHLTQQSWIGRIVINDKKQGISDATWMYVKAAIDHFKEKRPACVIVELNTPGGEIYASQRISNALRSLDMKDGIPVIAYVNNWAVSAGAMLAYSCRYIIVAPDATMGAATPVFQTQDGMKAAPEKINSAMRADFANRASFFGRNPDIVRAMVDPDIILVRRKGQIIALCSEGDLNTTPGEKDEVISPKGKLLSLTADQMNEFGVADMVVPKEIAFFPDDEIAQKSPVRQTPFRTIPELAAYPDVPVETFQMDMKTSVIAFFASPLVCSALAFVVFVCFYLEMSSPGMVLPGIVGSAALFLLLIGSFAQEALSWFEPLCVLVGLAFIAIELAFFPTLGFLLFIGGALLVFGIICLVVPGIGSVRFEGDTLNAAGEYVVHRLAWFSGAFLLAIPAIIYLSRHLSLKTLRFSGIILENPSLQERELPNICRGEECMVASPLRPSGKIEHNGHLFDAVSDGRYIEEKTRVHVVEVRGNIIVVEPVL